MSDRIRENKQSGELVIEPYRDVKKQQLLNIWIVLWTICGIGILAQFVLPQPEGMTTYLLVWLGFWLYFQIKVIHAYRWRRWGMEKLEVRESNLIYLREIKGRGIPKTFSLEQVKKPHITSYSGNSFFKIIGQSYWSPGTERVVFSYRGKEVLIGRELNDSDAKRVSEWIKKAVHSADL